MLPTDGEGYELMLLLLIGFPAKLIYLNFQPLEALSYNAITSICITMHHKPIITDDQRS